VPSRPPTERARERLLARGGDAARELSHVGCAAGSGARPVARLGEAEQRCEPEQEAVDDACALVRDMRYARYVHACAEAHARARVGVGRALEAVAPAQIAWAAAWSARASASAAGVSFCIVKDVITSAACASPRHHTLMCLCVPVVRVCVCFCVCLSVHARTRARVCVFGGGACVCARVCRGGGGGGGMCVFAPSSAKSTAAGTLGSTPYAWCGDTWRRAPSPVAATATRRLPRPPRLARSRSAEARSAAPAARRMRVRAFACVHMGPCARPRAGPCASSPGRVVSVRARACVPADVGDQPHQPLRTLRVCVECAVRDVVDGAAATSSATGVLQRAQHRTEPRNARTGRKRMAPAAWLRAPGAATCLAAPRTGRGRAAGLSRAPAEPSPGADVAGVSPIPVQMWQG
jgi:hypothetical protein